MSAEKEPEYYLKLLESDLDESSAKDYLSDVERILAGLEKGLGILKKLGREPESKVLENQKKFLDIEQKLKKILKK
ncbi:MAG: hypothetical protein ACO20H_04565 [Bacteriovoracaceae bacterium]